MTRSAKPPGKTTQQRLAAALRENLKRRKQQAKGRAGGAGTAGHDAGPEDGAETGELAKDPSNRPR